MQTRTGLNQLARLATLSQVITKVDSQFIGRLSRADGWSVQQWQLPWQVLFLVHEGSCQVSTSRQHITANTGQAVLLDPCRTQQVRFSKVLHYSELRFCISDARQRWVMRQPVVLLEQAYPLTGLIDQLARESRMQAQSQSQITSCLLGLILAYAHRLSQQTTMPANHLTTTQIDALIAHVQQHVGKTIMPHDLAKVLHLSPDYFSRLFKATLGQSPRAWLVSERMRHACRLLHDSLDNVDQVAMRVGYSSTTHFCRQFRSITGTTPNAYRQQNR